MIIRTSTLVVAAALAISVSPAAAQDPSQPATSGSRSLTAGFNPDPYTVDLVAGGSIDASRLGGTCVGKISSAPDFKLTYTAGGLPLVFRTRSGQDTTLVVNNPNGRWYCDDDSYGDGDAQVTFNSPQSGVYDVWVGTFNDTPTPADLLITETP